MSLRPSSAFWQDHALFAGAFVSVCLVGSGYLFIDSKLESARQERDEACLDEIKGMMEVGHLFFWISGIDLSPGSPRRRFLLEDLQYEREATLATQRTLGVIAQLSMGLLTEQGMAVTPKAIHAFRMVDDFVLKQAQAIALLGFEHGQSTPHADGALLRLQKAHTEAHNSYVDLVKAAGGRSMISEAEDEANSL